MAKSGKSVAQLIIAGANSFHLRAFTYRAGQTLEEMLMTNPNNPNQNPGQQTNKPGQQQQGGGMKPDQQHQGGQQKPDQQQQGGQPKPGQGAQK
jgi:hypothetical protein